jgi:hypothetical protein
MPKVPTPGRLPSRTVRLAVYRMRNSKDGKRGLGAARSNLPRLANAGRERPRCRALRQRGCRDPRNLGLRPHCRCSCRGYPPGTELVLAKKLSGGDINVKGRTGSWKQCCEWASWTWGDRDRRTTRPSGGRQADDRQNPASGTPPRPSCAEAGAGSDCRELGTAFRKVFYAWRPDRLF